MSNPLILALDIGGQPNRWIGWQDAVTYHAKNLVEWSLGEATFTFRGGENANTGKASAITTASIIAVRGKGKSKSTYRAPSLTNKVLFRRDKCVCTYCGTRFSDDELTRDHITPVSKGGPDTWVNCITACKKCNHYKSDFSVEDAGLKLQYQPYTPCRREWLILSNRKILPDQMDFLVSGITNVKSRFHR